MSEVWEQYMNQSQNKDDRELVTDDCIREDLLDRIKMTGLRLVLILPLLALLVYFLFIIPKLIIPLFLVYVLVIALLIYCIRMFVIALLGYFMNRKQIRVVTDKKCGEKILYPGNGSIITKYVVRYCYLFFTKYGKYLLPQTCFKWSDGNQMNNYQLMEISYDKDEFYLVLDKKDRILAAYPCKYFKYCDGGDIT